MDEEDIQDDLARATEIGVENLAIISLAAAWCEHIGVTKGPMGTGLVEQATGLPISGGSLRCQYATAPTSFGMVLKHNAVEFYERNCVGCAYHKPTGRTPNLRTWSDEIIARRNEEARRVQVQRDLESEQRRRRSEERRFLLGAPAPSVQANLDLVKEGLVFQTWGNVSGIPKDTAKHKANVFFITIGCSVDLSWGDFFSTLAIASWRLRQ